MPILTVTDVAKSYGDLEILREVTCNLEPKERVGLIGRNGTGKTTLLRLFAKLEEPDQGHISLAEWAQAAYLPQAFEGPAEVTVLAHVLAGATDVHALAARLQDLEHRMASPEIHDDPVRLRPVMEEYGHVREHFEHAGGFTLETRAKTVLTGLRFREADFERPLSILSGGWRVRAELARVLLLEPDLLLLDEPTNHLDLETTEWLEAYLQSFPGAVIVVSHDRYLLDAVTTRTLELEDGRIESYPAPYTTAMTLKAERVRRQQEVWERQQEEIAKLEAYIRRYKAGNRATQAKSREKMLSRVEAARIERPRDRKTIRMTADGVPHSGRLVVRLKAVSKRFAATEVLHNVNLEIYRGERIGLLGPNGAGKTTLLKVIASIEPPTSGRATLGGGVSARYFAQESTEALEPSNTILDEILADRPLTPEQIRTYLGRFLFSGEEVFKRIAMLSGGERQRLSLAKLLLEKPNLLLLDEPTNHLDIPSREALEAALREFPGTMVVATHDRYLLERLATRILTVQAHGLTDFHGTYHELRERRAHEARQRSTPRAPVESKPRRSAPRPSRPTFDEVATQIAAIERELHDVGGWLADPELYRDPPRVKAMRQRYEEARQRLQVLYDTLAEIEADASGA